MSIPMVKLGHVSVSKFIIGGNPFSGFSHQSVERDRAMVDYYSTAKIKQALARAERLGINTHLGRADHHIMRVLNEYWNEGGKIQWIAQTCPELGTIERAVQNAIRGKAKACFVHGGETDLRLAQGKLDELPAAIAKIRAAGMPAGIAGHNPKVFEWAQANLDVDFFMCCYYNPSARDQNAGHVHGAKEWFRPEDRDRMLGVIAGLKAPVIHYKVLAAGRTPPAEAFDLVARHLRPQDAVCVGIHEGDKADMLDEDVKLLLAALAKHQAKTVVEKR